MTRVALTLAIAALVAACTPEARVKTASQQPVESVTPASVSSPTPSNDSTVRLFVADMDTSNTRLCFESPDLGVPAGAPVTVVYATHPQYVTRGTLGTRAIRPCSPPRRGSEDSVEYSVTVPPDTSGPRGLPIIVVGTPPKLEMHGDTVTLEIEPGKTPWRFRSCASAEGIWSSAWAGVPLASPRRWNYYYYLGYDVEPDCKPGDYESEKQADANPPLTWGDSIEAAESNGIREANGKVSRSGPELRIQLLNGRTVVFRDDTTVVAAPVSRYAGYLKAIHSHVVHRVPYEGTGIFVVVDDSTGDSTTVSGMPVPSPDGRRFVLTSMSGEEDTDASVIEVWRMHGRKPENEFSHDTGHEAWEPSDATWRNPTTIDFIENSHTDPSQPYVRKPARLTWNGTTWILSEVPAKP